MIFDFQFDGPGFLKVKKTSLGKKHTVNTFVRFLDIADTSEKNFFRQRCMKRHTFYKNFFDIFFIRSYKIQKKNLMYF